MSYYNENRLMQTLLSEFEMSTSPEQFTLTQKTSGKAVSAPWEMRGNPHCGHLFLRAFELCKTHFPQAKYLSVYRSETGLNMLCLQKDWEVEFGYKFHVALRKGCDSKSAYLWWKLLGTLPGPCFGFVMESLMDGARKYFGVSALEPLGRWVKLKGLDTMTRDVLEQSFQTISDYCMAILRQQQPMEPLKTVKEKEMWEYLREELPVAKLEQLQSHASMGCCSADYLSFDDVQGIWYFHLCEAVEDSSVIRPLPEFKAMQVENSPPTRADMTTELLRTAACAAKEHLGFDLVRRGERICLRNEKGQLEDWTPLRDNEQCWMVAKAIAKQNPELQSVADALGSWEKETAQSGDPYEDTRRSLLAYLAKGRAQSTTMGYEK